MRLIHEIRLLTVTPFLFAWVTSSHADSIGINFSTGRSEITGGTVPGEAGVVVQANWNNVDGTGGTVSNLIDDGGTPTGVSVVWTANNSWSISDDQQNLGNDGLMNGYLDTTNTSTTTITISDLDYAEYDVIVYMDGDGLNRSGRYSVAGSGPAQVKDPLFDLGTWSGTFIEAAESGEAGNYSRWTEISGSTLVITARASTANGQGVRAPINAVQIIERAAAGGPRVSTLAAENLTSSAATIRGSLDDAGTSDVSARLYWGSADGGRDSGAWEHEVNLGVFTSPEILQADLDALMPSSTYFFRAFAENASGDHWAASTESFVTLADPPVVINLAAENVEATSAVVGVQVTANGGDDPMVSIFFGRTDGGSNAESWENSVDLGVVIGEGTATLTNLSPSQTYYYRARAMNNGGTAWAAVSSTFSTPAVLPPSIVNRTPGSITGRTAALRGSVTQTGGELPAVTIHFGEADGGDDPAAWDSAIDVGVEGNDFSRFVTGLTPETTYYYRCSAVNSAGVSWAPDSISFQTTADVPPSVVINEIHYDPGEKTSPEEFIELHNPGDEVVDLSGWSLSDGIAFEFAEGTTVDPRGYVVVARDPSRIEAVYGVAALGPFSGRLSNDGEEIDLRDIEGALVDSVNYGAGFPWPTGARGGGSSMELVHPGLDNDLGGSWRSSGAVAAPADPAVYVSASSTGWRYRKGTSNPPTDWQTSGFVEDGSWLSGQTPIGYGDGDDNTVVGDMQNGYWSLYFRKSFTLAPDQIPPAVVLRVYVDDGAIVWINDHEIPRFHVSEGDKDFDDSADDHEAEWEELYIPNAGAILGGGTNVVAAHALNSTFASSDFSFDLELRTPDGSEIGGVPTPGAANSVWTTDIPPQIRQVEHAPAQPRSAEPVLVTAKITDPDGVGEVSLSYQLVDPGNYVRKTDASYEVNWTTVVMRDDGSAGDMLAQDSIYTVTLPANVQQHRRLVRYRIDFADLLGNAAVVPYGDDTQGNFAYFVYDGPPAWSGAFNPGAGPVVEYPAELLDDFPIYHLIARETDVINSQYNGGSDGVHMLGTLVYDGEVYDHIEFENRGEASTYVSGKNKWRFHFNRARRFEARDNWNKRYGTPWNVMNVDACVAPWAAVHRGSAGIEEAVSYRLYELAGVPSARTHFFHFRIVDAEEELSATDQYEGDLWGLYLVLEHPDGSFLDDRGLPDGNVYKIEGSNGDKKHQGETQPTDSSDWNSFRSASQSNQPLSWWRANMDLSAYYSFRACNRISGNVDVREGWNHYFYHSPDGGWMPLPWDLDMMVIAETHWSGTIQQKVCLNDPTINLEFKNRCRELLDLMCSDGAPDGGQIGQLIHEYAEMVNPEGAELTWADLDAAMWNYHPRTQGSAGSHSGQTNHRGNFFYSPFTDTRIGGNWTRTLTSADHEGFVRFFIDYATDTFSGGSWAPGNGNQRGYGYEYLALEAQDNAIPDKPSITYVGSAGYPSDDLRFQSSSFSDPQGNGSFGAMKWRLAELSAPGLAGYQPGEPWNYEVETVWESGELTAFAPQLQLPTVEVRPDHTCRVRVAHRDTTGRWSHWSDPIEFVAASPDITLWQESLVITEIMYHPPAPSGDELLVSSDQDDYEFIELRNVGTTTLDLSNVRFTKGIDFDFADGSVTTLEPGAFVLVVKNLAAFEARYGTGLPVAGVYEGNLSNGGELLKLSYGGGVPIHEFAYGDTEPWPLEADGSGASLRLVDSAGGLDPSDPSNWMAMAAPDPGAENDPTEQEFPLTMSINGNGTLTPSPGGLVYARGTTVVIEAAAANGWRFVGWDGDLTGSANPASIVMDGAKSITANFVVQYPLTIEAVENGTITVSPDMSIFDAGTQVTLTAVPNPGYVFAGWEGDASGGTNPLTIIVDGAKSISASFTRIRYGITAEVSAGMGAVMLEPDQPSYPAGQEVRVTAVAEEGWRFKGWSGDLSGSVNPATIVVDSEESIGAEFIAQYALMVQQVEHGTLRVSPDLSLYDAGTEVVVTAEAETGYVFSGWSGDASGTANPLALTIDRAMAISAVFAEEIESSPFQQWLRGYFSPAELEVEALTGPLADPDEDGSVNLFEYFHRTDPTRPASVHSPALVQMPADGDGNGAWALRYRESTAGDASLQVTIEYSTNGMGWVEASISEETAEALEPGVIQRSATLMLPAGVTEAAALVRMRLTLSPQE